MFNPDTELARVSEDTGISIAVLKAVYLRGVDEFRSSSDETSTATIYGCARVQQFVNGSKRDADLTACEASSHVFEGADVNVDAQSMYTDILYDNADALSKLFYPNTISSVKIEDGCIVLAGEDWTYKLDTSSGNHTVAMR